MNVPASSRLLVAALIVAGSVARLRPHLERRSLLIDEAAVALNVRERPLGALLGGRLDDHQVAPPGFLAAVRTCMRLGRGGEGSLRAFPLACSLAALALFPFVAARAVRPSSVPLATALFAFSPVLVQYAVQVKPYAGDALAALGLTAIGLAWPAGPGTMRQAWGAAAAGVVAIGFSLPAPMVLAGIGSAWGISRARARDRAGIVRLAVPAAAWLLAAGGAVILARRGEAWSGVLGSYWSGAYLAFPPLRPSQLDTHLSVDVGFFRDVLGLPLPELGFFLSLAGGVALAASGRRRTLAVLGFPVVAFLAANAAGFYPVAWRLLLFLAPAACLLAAEGIASLRLPPFSPIVPSLLLGGALVAAPAAGALRDPGAFCPRAEVRDLLPSLDAGWRDGDALYVTHEAWPAFLYYAGRDRYPGAVRGARVRDDIDAFRTDLGRVPETARLWLLHADPHQSPEAVLRPFLAGIGMRRAAFHAPGAALLLLELERPDAGGAR